MTTHRRDMPASADPPPRDGIAGRVPVASDMPSRPAVGAAMLAYLGVLVAGFLPPLVVYLVSWRSAFARRHAAEALRVSFAAILYGICLLIIAAMLALDSITVAVIAAALLGLALWLVVAVWVARAAREARSGEPPLEFPGWLRVSPRS
jgi:uncharacterized Tic20 family protein